MWVIVISNIVSIFKQNLNIDKKKIQTHWNMSTIIETNKNTLREN